MRNGWLGTGNVRRVVAVNDDDLHWFKELPRLRILRLGAAPVSDAGLGTLGSLQCLEELDLSGTRISDNGLRHVTRLRPSCASWLNQTRITDKGLVHLQKLSRLERLELYDAEVTKRGASQLAEWLPRLSISSRFYEGRRKLGPLGPKDGKGVESNSLVPAPPLGRHRRLSEGGMEPPGMADACSGNGVSNVERCRERCYTARFSLGQPFRFPEGKSVLAHLKALGLRPLRTETCCITCAFPNAQHHRSRESRMGKPARPI